MRIVASACLVLVILFMVGCGASAEDKKAITDNTAAITALTAQVNGMKPMADQMNARLTTIETFLKDPKSKFGTGAFMAPPDTTKKAPEAKPAAKPAAPKTGGTKPPAPPTKTK